jgi:type IV secretion system protein VirB3
LKAPAWRAGVRAGDRVEAIDDEPTAGVSLREIVARLRGPVGTSVVVGVATPAAESGATLDPGAALPGYFAPVHRALTEQILLGGAPRSVAIVNGTLAGAVGLGLRLWLVGLLLWAVGHAAAVWAARRDAQFLEVVRAG